MTTTAQTQMTLPNALKRLDWRGALVVVAAIAVVLELPVWLRAPLSVAAAIGAISFCVTRRRQREPIDSALRAVGGVAVVLVVLGLVLNFLPTGLTAPGWGIGIGVIELATMVGFAVREPSPAPPRAPSLLAGPAGRRRVLGVVVWGVLVGGVLTGALLLALDSYSRTHISPVALGAETSRGSTVVTVASDRSEGPLELRLVTDDGDTTVLRSGIRVGPDAERTTVRVPSSTVGRLELVAEDGTRPLRTLILDGSIGKGDG